ncbi:MAG: hypothetical protein LBJ71_04970 [Holosporaceae bacterium]|nr:hypothetical protein [Holosporaceae bacterium]
MPETEILHDPALDAVEHLPGIGGLLEGARDLERIHSGLQELRPIADKWRNIGFFGLLMGKNAESVAGELFESVAKVEGKVAVKLTPYGGPGGGHHIDSKAGYIGHPSYDFRKALCLSNQKLAELGIEHKKVTLAQQRLFIEFNKSNRILTREIMNDIQVRALIEGGASGELARSLVAESQWWLKNQGIRHPINRPYERKR